MSQTAHEIVDRILDARVKAPSLRAVGTSLGFHLAMLVAAVLVKATGRSSSEMGGTGALTAASLSEASFEDTVHINRLVIVAPALAVSLFAHYGVRKSPSKCAFTRLWVLKELVSFAVLVAWYSGVVATVPNYSPDGDTYRHIALSTAVQVAWEEQMLFVLVGTVAAWSTPFLTVVLVLNSAYRITTMLYRAIPDAAPQAAAQGLGTLLAVAFFAVVIIRIAWWDCRNGRSKLSLENVVTVDLKDMAERARQQRMPLPDFPTGPRQRIRPPSSSPLPRPSIPGSALASTETLRPTSGPGSVRSESPDLDSPVSHVPVIPTLISFGLLLTLTIARIFFVGALIATSSNSSGDTVVLRLYIISTLMFDIIFPAALLYNVDRAIEQARHRLLEAQRLAEVESRVFAQHRTIRWLSHEIRGPLQSMTITQHIEDMLWRGADLDAMMQRHASSVSRDEDDEAGSGASQATAPLRVPPIPQPSNESHRTSERGSVISRPGRLAGAAPSSPVGHLPNTLSVSRLRFVDRPNAPDSGRARASSQASQTPQPSPPPSVNSAVQSSVTRHAASVALSQARSAGRLATLQQGSLHEDEATRIDTGYDDEPTACGEAERQDFADRVTSGGTQQNEPAASPPAGSASQFGAGRSSPNQSRMDVYESFRDDASSQGHQPVAPWPDFGGDYASAEGSGLFSTSLADGSSIAKNPWESAIESVRSIDSQVARINLVLRDLMTYETAEFGGEEREGPLCLDSFVNDVDGLVEKACRRDGLTVRRDLRIGDRNLSGPAPPARLEGAQRQMMWKIAHEFLRNAVTATESGGIKVTIALVSRGSTQLPRWSNEGSRETIYTSASVLGVIPVQVTGAPFQRRVRSDPAKSSLPAGRLFGTRKNTARVAPTGPPSYSHAPSSTVGAQSTGRSTSSGPQTSGTIGSAVRTATFETMSSSQGVFPESSNGDGMTSPPSRSASSRVGPLNRPKGPPRGSGTTSGSQGRGERDGVQSAAADLCHSVECESSTFEDGKCPPLGWDAPQRMSLGSGVALKSLVEEASTNGAIMVLEVSDSGCGIRPDEYMSVFEPFARLRTAKASRGTGLGLATCRALARAQDGFIGVHSAGPGKGTSFWVEIPVTLLVESNATGLEGSAVSMLTSTHADAAHSGAPHPSTAAARAQSRCSEDYDSKSATSTSSNPPLPALGGQFDQRLRETRSGSASTEGTDCATSSSASLRTPPAVGNNPGLRHSAHVRALRERATASQPALSVPVDSNYQRSTPGTTTASQATTSVDTTDFQTSSPVAVGIMRSATEGRSQHLGRLPAIRPGVGPSRDLMQATPLLPKLQGTGPPHARTTVPPRPALVLERPIGARRTRVVRRANLVKPLVFRKRVAVVDDQRGNRKSLIHHISPNGAEYVEACDGLDMLNKLSALGKGPAFDIIFLDKEMPNVDGYVFLSALRVAHLVHTGQEIPEEDAAIRDLLAEQNLDVAPLAAAWTSTPVIGVTANTTASDLDEFLRLGAREVCPKPVTQRALASAISRALRTPSPQPGVGKR